MQPATWLLLALILAGGARGAEEIVWKPVNNGVVKMDDRPVKRWNAYRTNKKDQFVLVQIGERFLLLDTEAHEVYELAPATLRQKKGELRWDTQTRPAAALPTADWNVRDVGPARRIRLRLTVEGRALEVQVPIQQDLRRFY